MPSASNDPMYKVTRFHFDIVSVFVVSIIAIIGIFLLPEGNIIRTILGIPYLFFIPGYVVSQLLIYRKKKHKLTIEQIAVSIGLSIAIVAIIGMLLQYSPIELNLVTAAINIFLVILIATILTFKYRDNAHQHRLDKINIFTIIPRDIVENKKALLSVIACVILLLATITYVSLAPIKGERYTEIYILDENNTTEDYPLSVEAGDEATVILGLVCHEYTTTTYTIGAGFENANGWINVDNWDQSFDLGRNIEYRLDVTLDHEERTESEFTFTISHPGEYKTVWSIYSDGDHIDEVYLWITVS